MDRRAGSVSFVLEITLKYLFCQTSYLKDNLRLLFLFEASNWGGTLLYSKLVEELIPFPGHH